MHREERDEAPVERGDGRRIGRRAPHQRTGRLQRGLGLAGEGGLEVEDI
ncbi:MAG: hypothetical protein R3F65_07990 [bacterium]